MVSFTLHARSRQWGPFPLLVLATAIVLAYWYLGADWRLAGRGRNWAWQAGRCASWVVAGKWNRWTATRSEPLASSPTTVLTLALRGMTCGASAARIERRLNRIEGVSARVNYATERASVLILPHVQPERLLEEVASIGYSAEMVSDGPPSATADSADDLVRSLRRRLFVAAVLLMPLGDASLLFWLVAGIRFPGWQWLLLVLAAPVVGWAAWPFYRAALRAARHGATTMDTLVSIGIVSSTVWSVYAMFWRDTSHSSRSLWWTLAHGSSGGIYLEVGAGVTTFLLAGRYFEARARRQAPAKRSARSPSWVRRTWPSSNPMGASSGSRSRHWLSAIASLCDRGRRWRRTEWLNRASLPSTAVP